MNNKRWVYLAAGIGGIISGILLSPDKGVVNRLKFKRKINQVSVSALEKLDELETQLKPIT